MTDNVKHISDMGVVQLEQIRSVGPTALPNTNLIGYAQREVVRIPYWDKNDKMKFDVIKFESSIYGNGKKIVLGEDGGYVWGTKVIVNILEDGYAMVEV